MYICTYLENLGNDKMVKYKFFATFFSLFEIIVTVFASTHWVVTENGRIISHLNSPLHLRRSYDLFGLLDQESRLTNIDTLYQDLISRKSLIDKKWSGLEGASDLESRFYSQDADCLKAGKLLSEIDLYTSIAADGSDRDGIDITDFLIDQETPDSDVVPDCEKSVPLDFSMFVFEHLAGMVNRANLSITPEKTLEQWFKPGTTIARLGHQVTLNLLKNNTSWLHHNLGSIYWRIKGDALNAIECGRRAVHFAPREYRDIALLNLASIFHQARYPGEAAIILHAAVDHAPHQPANHYALGNVYVVLADYNRSIACYDNFLKLRPGLQDAVTAKHATLCHRKIERGLMDLYESLQEVLSELHDYHSQQEQWLRLQDRLMWEQAPLEAKLINYNPEKFNIMLANRGQSCMQRNGDDSKPMLSCDLNTDTQLMAHNLQIDLTLSLQMLLRNVESQAQKISEQMARGKRDVNKIVSQKTDKVMSDFVPSFNMNSRGDESMPPAMQPKYPAGMVVTKALSDFESPGWPTKQQCSDWKVHFDYDKERTYSLFLPPENKGFEVTKIFSEYIGLPTGSEHALPWYPPICQFPDDGNAVHDHKYFPATFIRTQLNAPLSSDPSLQSHLLSYVNQGKVTEAEIGQRIITAINQKAGPNWLLATIASLYWRVRSNTRNTIDCLNIALKTVPPNYRDVVLISIGSVLHELGYMDDALRITLEAFSINKLEPATNFLLAILYNKIDNPVIASFHLKQSLKMDSEFYNGEAAKLLKIWSCKSRLRTLDEAGVKSEGKDGMCAERESVTAEGVICSAGGEQCKAAAIQCYRADSIPDDVEIQSISKFLANDHCAHKKLGLGHSLISTLLATNHGDGAASADRSAVLEHDQLHLEKLQLDSLSHEQQQAFHMRISLGDENAPISASTLGDFYVSVTFTDEPKPEAMLYVYDKSGTYPLSPKGCQAIKDADWLHFSSMWQSIAARNMDIGPLLKPADEIQETLKPQCDESLPPSPTTLDHLSAMRLRFHHKAHVPEPALAEWLGLMAGDQRASVTDLGTRIAVALQENTTSWILATAAAIFWRTVGATDEAITCLRQALTYAPNDAKDIPLINLANVLHRVGFNNDALEVAYMALDNRPNFVVNHFTVGNIHTSLGDLEKAISFYRSSLVLDANFEPARNRLQAILCTLLFDETGSLRESTDITEN